MLLSMLLLLVSTQTGCRPGVVADGGVAVLSIDLDGDSERDEVRVEGREVQLRRSNPRSTTELYMGWEKFGGLLVDLEKFPVEARSPNREAVLRFIEDSVFDKTCVTADPSLQRLLQQGEKKTPLTWIKGPVNSPFSYLIRRNGAWLLYRSYCYAPRTTPDAFGPSPPQEAAREGKWVVLKTCHGVVLNDLEQNQFAWLYLLDQPIDKLRHSSIGDVAIADGVVTIQLTLDTLEAPRFVEVKVRIDDGTINVVKGARK